MRTFAVIYRILIVIFLMVNEASAGARNPQTDTSSGVVEGMDKEGVLVFKGIPYAEPPVGDMRFKTSVMKEKEDGIILAHDFGPACIQEPSAKVPAAGVAEDCLSLNVWAPALDGEKRPVMVWIHGGSNINGTGAEPRFHGDAFARRGDVVFVTINYRLGVLGYFDFSEIGGDEYSDSVNNGLKDQMLALEWVRENIDSFSGDPENVTVVGESAGAAAVVALLGTDNPEEIFDRAILQSRPLLTKQSDAKIIARTYKEQAEKNGIESVEDWLSMDEDEVLEFMLKVKEQVGSLTWDRFHGPTYGEGLVLPERPEERFKKGHASALPIIIGTTMDESRLWAHYDPSLCDQVPFNNELTEGNFMLGLGAYIMTNVIKMDLTKTDPNRKSFSDAQAMLSLTDEVFFRIPSYEMADAHSDGGGKTYMYIFEYPVNHPENCVHNSSPHAVETPFVFNKVNVDFNLVRLGPSRNEDDDKTRSELADTTQETWISFARSGEPNMDGSPLGIWPLYESDKKKTLIISSNPRVVNNPFGIERKVIKMVGADKTDLIGEE